MSKFDIITINKKINEDNFLTILLIDIENLTIINQIYEENKENIINLSYEKETNILTIKTKKECIIKITEYTDEEIINYSKEILNEIKKIDNYNPSLPPENEFSISLKKIFNFLKAKRNQLEKLFKELSKKPYYFNNYDIDKNSIILKNNNIPEAKIIGNNLIPISNKDIVKLLNVGKEIIEKYNKYQEFLEDNCKEIKSINSDFILEITPNSITLKKDKNPFFLKYSYNNSFFELEEANYLTFDVLYKIENEDLFSKIFFQPKKCPIWIQKMLKEERKEVERIMNQLKQKIEANKNINDKTDLVSFYELLNYQRNYYVSSSSCYEENTNPIYGNFCINNNDSFSNTGTTILKYKDINSKEYEIEIIYDEKIKQYIYITHNPQDEIFLQLIKPNFQGILENIYCRKSSLSHDYQHLWKDKDFDKQKKEFINNIKDIDEIIKEKNNTNKDDYISLEEIFKNLSIIIEDTNNNINPVLEIKRKSINSNIELNIDYLSIKIFYNYETDFHKAETFGASFNFKGEMYNNIDGYKFFPDSKKERDELFSQIFFSKEDLPEWIIIKEKEVQKNKSNKLLNFFGG